MCCKRTCLFDESGGRLDINHQTNLTPGLHFVLLLLGLLSTPLVRACSSSKSQESPLLELDDDILSKGIMFDISARRNLTVNTLEINFQEILIDMDYFVSVWTKPDTYLGFESNASAWENIFIARVRVPLSTENTTLLPPERFNPRDVAQGSSQSFYIAVQSTNEMPISSSKGLQPGSVAIMNKDLMIHQGVAHQSIFPTVSSVSGVISLARLNYSVCEANYTEEAALCPGSDDWSLSTRMDGETVTNGIFFDAVARSNVTVVGLDMRLKKRSSDKDIIVTVWTKEGTHEGFEGNVSAWTPIFSSSVTYGLDGLVSLPESLFDFVDIVEGSSQGFYMAVRDTDELVMMVSSGSNVGAPFATSCAIQINTGKQADASFEASETASLNGVFRYMACPSNIDCNDTLPPDSIISYDCPNEEERNLNTSASALAMDGHTLVKISESTRDLKSGGICYLGENNSMSGCSRYIFKEACAFAGLRIESQGDPKVTYVINNDLVINCSRTRTEEQW